MKYSLCIIMVIMTILSPAAATFWAGSRYGYPQTSYLTGYGGGGYYHPGAAYTSGRYSRYSSNYGYGYPAYGGEFVSLSFRWWILNSACVASTNHYNRFNNFNNKNHRRWMRNGRIRRLRLPQWIWHEVSYSWHANQQPQQQHSPQKHSIEEL